MDQTIARRLASYAADLSYSDLDDQTIEMAKRRIVDSVATGYAALDADPVKATRDYALGKDGERSTFVLGGGTSSLDHAVLATGTAIRYLDWNDTYLSLEPGHPSDNLGAILPVAAAYDRSGKDVLVATALAYEIQGRLCDAASLRSNGFDHVNYGLVSVPLAAGTLMGLDEAQLADAVRIAVNGHVALRQARAGQLTEWKGMAFSNAARNGVVAAELAAAGIHGPAPIFEGTFGFHNQVAGPVTLETDSFGGNAGEFLLTKTYIKRYPVEYHAQAAVNCALDLLEAHDLDWHEIELIENETYEAAVSIIADEEKWDPETRETADHSLPYCIARAFIDGEMTLSQFTESKVKADDVRTLMDRIEIEENPEYTERYGEQFPHRMVVHTATETYECEKEYPRGHYANPLTDARLRRKFTEGTKGHLSERDRDDVLTTFDRFESLENVAEMFPLV